MPASTPNRTCSHCGSSVARKDCHRNRYGEYVCRSCQAAGFKHSLRGKAAFRTKRTLAKMIRWLGWVVLCVIALTSVYHLIDRYASGSSMAQPQE